MGKFFTALHIKCSGKERFIKEFTQLMKKDGYVPCSDDEAALSYAAAFSEGGWVTLSNGDDSTNELSKTAAKIAEGMNTSCLTAEVVDSDFGILELHAPSGRTSRVVVGDGEGYGVEKAPFSADDWKPLLQNGDVEKLLAETGRDSTFVEDDLVEIGGLLGISDFAITADHDEFSENEGAFNLSFRKAAEKKMTLNAAFKQVFGEALEPLGFKLIKSKYPYFVRVVPGGEIVHIISYMDMWNPYPGRKTFDIIGGIATVYRPKIDLSILPSYNGHWLSSISRYYSRLTPESEYDDEYRKSIYSFEIEEESRSSLYNVMNYTLELTQKYIIPQLNTAVDLKSSLSYLKRLGQSCSRNSFNLNASMGVDEGLLYIITDDKVLKSRLEKVIDGSLPTDEKTRQEAENDYKFFNDPVIHEKVLLELDRRKAVNTEILRSYGLSL